MGEIMAEILDRSGSSGGRARQSSRSWRGRRRRRTRRRRPSKNCEIHTQQAVDAPAHEHAGVRGSRLGATISHVATLKLDVSASVGLGADVITLAAKNMQTWLEL